MTNNLKLNSIIKVRRRLVLKKIRRSYKQKRCFFFSKRVRPDKSHSSSYIHSVKAPLRIVFRIIL